MSESEEIRGLRERISFLERQISEVGLRQEFSHKESEQLVELLKATQAVTVTKIEMSQAEIQKDISNFNTDLGDLTKRVEKNENTLIEQGKMWARLVGIGIGAGVGGGGIVGFILKALQ